MPWRRGWGGLEGDGRLFRNGDLSANAMKESLVFGKSTMLYTRKDAVLLFVRLCQRQPCGPNPLLFFFSQDSTDEPPEVGAAGIPVHAMPGALDVLDLKATPLQQRL